MKISIITATYNSAATIGDTIKSILSQSYENIEVVIQDGGSSDNTLDIVRSFDDERIKIFQEKDKGIYDAMNKGIENTSGDIIGILNSDDFYADHKVLEKVANVFNNETIDSAYGDLQYVDEFDTTQIRRTWISGKYNYNSWRKGWMPPHPTFFVRRTLYQKYGKFNLELKSAADYELMLRFLYKNKVSTTYIKDILVKMREGGQSNASIKNRIKANKEDLKAWELNDLKAPTGLRVLKPLRKIMQFIRK